MSYSKASISMKLIKINWSDEKWNFFKQLQKHQLQTTQLRKKSSFWSFLTQFISKFRKLNVDSFLIFEQINSLRTYYNLKLSHIKLYQTLIRIKLCGNILIASYCSDKLTYKVYQNSVNIIRSVRIYFGYNCFLLLLRFQLQ